MATNAQEAYLASESPAQAPTWTGDEVLFNAWHGKHDERERQYREAQAEYNAQKLLTKAQWEREDSQYQRMVNDLKAAGINPYYALNNGLGSPSSSSGESLYSTKGKSSQKEKSNPNYAGLIAAAAMLIKVLLA